MDILKNKCGICGQVKDLIPHNNPLVQPTCFECAAKQIDVNNIEEIEFFCRIFNLPFKPAIMLRIEHTGAEKIKNYIAALDGDDLEYRNSFTHTWKKLQEEWEKVQTHDELVAKLAPIKEGFTKRAKIKWGMGFTFTELIRLENMFINVIRSNGITDPIQIENVKKVCKLTILIDQKMEEMEDIKTITGLSDALAKFTKLAKLDEYTGMASEGTIKSVSDLCNFLESNGFKFTFYDNVDRDIVDKSIKDIQDTLIFEVRNATGLDVALQDLKEKYERKVEVDASEAAYEKVELHQIMEEADKANEELDIELESEEIFYDDDF